ncbi:phospholipase D family protein [Marinobacter daepoensis]|uniref:phospholipase D family protein n=1 Tax=Marinobacter daepoensis TaxID=262077 RepID=UPI000402B95A|nr:phospholipase D family protein [Marinobacter daepoensis]
MTNRTLLNLLLLVVLLPLASGCALPALEHKAEHTAITPDTSAKTPLGLALAPLLEAQPSFSGVYPLALAEDAFIARMLLTTVADKSIDAQYYIWHRDITGLLLLDALKEAADRGVRVRLLVDDNGISGLDDLFVALARHPNFHIRLFNPFVVRSPKWLGYITDFSRLNRRMHNKSFIVDNQAAIVGGRNIGDEYFGATEGLLFSDLDVMAVGPVVNEASNDFDRYWNHDLSYPAQSIAGATNERPETLLAGLRAEHDPQRQKQYLDALKSSAFLEQMIRGDLQLHWSHTRMVSDDPDKILSEAPKEALLSQQLGKILGHPQRSLTLISPYFVPTQAGVEYFQRLAAQGVRVRILTNSLEATDVAAVHSGYARYRKPLIKAGIELYEMRKQGNLEHESSGSAGPFGSSGSSLHAKTFIVDEETVFVGSFNFDPRSLNLNTELGFVIDNAHLASLMKTQISGLLPVESYQVRLDSQGKLYWVEQNGHQKTIHNADPYSPAPRRFMVWLLSLLPLESML